MSEIPRRLPCPLRACESAKEDIFKMCAIIEKVDGTILNSIEMAIDYLSGERGM
jgi:hypothetical protein